MESLEEIYNGVKPEVLLSDSDKPKKSISLKEAKEQALRDAGNGVPFSSSTAYSNFDKGVKFGTNNPYSDSRYEDAEAQTFGQYLGRFTGNTLANIVTGTVGAVGTLGTLLQSGKERTYSNDIVDWADSVNNPFGDIKTKSDNKLDITDPAFWTNNGQGLVESAIQFGVIAESGGLATAGALNKLNSIFKLSNTAMKVGSAIGQTATAVELSYIEGAMSGAQVYRDIYDNRYKEYISQGLSVEEADNKAKEFASKGAATTVQLNTTINTALNLTGLGAVFNREISPSIKYFTEGLGKRLEGEGTKEYIARLASQSPEFINQLGKIKYGSYFAEMGQEGIEEVVTQLAENVGREQGQKEKSYGFAEQFKEATKSISSVMNDEGILNFALGSLGGLSQNIVLNDIIPSQKINKLDSNGKLIPKIKDGNVVLDKSGNVVYETRYVSPRKRDSFNNLKVFNDLGDALSNDLNWIQEQSDKIATETNPIKKEEYRRQLFSVNTLDSIYKGLGNNLIESYRSVANTDNTKDLYDVYNEQAKSIKQQADSIINGRELDSLEQEEKEQVAILEQQYKELSKKAFDNKGNTEASVLGLTNNKEDNDYKSRADKAIRHIKETSDVYEKYKAKYNLPEEEAVHFAEYLTKLHSDVLGRTQIQQDLEADYLKNKADFQLFSDIKDYSVIEDILSSTELLAIEQEKNNLTSALSELDSDNISESRVQEINDSLEVKVNSKEEAKFAVSKKLEKLDNSYNEKLNDFTNRVSNTEAYKKSNSKDPLHYVNKWIKKYPDYKRLVEFKTYLDNYKLNTNSLKEKLVDATSNSGRNKYVKDQQAVIENLKRQVELEHNVFTYEQAFEELQNEQYYDNIDKIVRDKNNIVKREIKRITREIEVLENHAKSYKNDSKYTSFINHFLIDSNIAEQLKMRKARLQELNDMLTSNENKGNQAKAKVTEAKGNKEAKDNAVDELETGSPLGEGEEGLNDLEAGSKPTPKSKTSDEGEMGFSKGREDFLADDDDDILDIPDVNSPISESELSNNFVNTFNGIYANQKRIQKVKDSPYILDGKPVKHRVSSLAKGLTDSSTGKGTSNNATKIGTALDKIARTYLVDSQGVYNRNLVDRAINQKNHKALKTIFNNANTFLNISNDERNEAVTYNKQEVSIAELLATNNEKEEDVLDKVKILLKYKDNKRSNAYRTFIDSAKGVKLEDGTVISFKQAFKFMQYMAAIKQKYNNYYLLADSIVLFDNNTSIGSVAGETDIIALKHNNDGSVTGKILDFKTGFYNNLSTDESTGGKYDKVDSETGLSRRDEHTNQTSIYSVLLHKQYGVKLTNKSRILPIAVSYDNSNFKGDVNSFSFLDSTERKVDGKISGVIIDEFKESNYELDIDYDFVKDVMYDDNPDKSSNISQPPSSNGQRNDEDENTEETKKIIRILELVDSQINGEKITNNEDIQLINNYIDYFNLLLQISSLKNKNISDLMFQKVAILLSSEIYTLPTIEKINHNVRNNKQYDSSIAKKLFDDINNYALEIDLMIDSLFNSIYSDNKEVKSIIDKIIIINKDINNRLNTVYSTYQKLTTNNSYIVSKLDNEIKALDSKIKSYSSNNLKDFINSITIYNYNDDSKVVSDLTNVIENVSINKGSFKSELRKKYGNDIFDKLSIEELKSFHDRLNSIISEADELRNNYKKLMNEVLMRMDNPKVKEVIDFVNTIIAELNIQYGNTNPIVNDLVKLLRNIRNPYTQQITEAELYKYAEILARDNKFDVVALYNLITSINEKETNSSKNIKTLITQINKIKDEIKSKTDEESEDDEEDNDDDTSSNKLPPKEVANITFDDEIPVPLNMLRIQYGNVDSKGSLSTDAIKSYTLKGGEEVLIKYDANNPYKKEDAIGIYILNNGKEQLYGYLPTIEFMNTKYGYSDKSKGDFTKAYLHNSTNPDILREYDFFVKEISRLNFNINDYIVNTKEATIVNYQKFNVDRIKYIRDKFANNKDLVLKTKIIGKSDGRAITGKNKQTYRAIKESIDNDTNVTLIYVSEGTSYPSKFKFSNKAINTIANNKLGVFLYLTYPNANGFIDIHPVATKKLGKEKVKNLLSVLKHKDRDSAYSLIKSNFTMFGDNNTEYRNTSKLFSYNNLTNTKGRTVRDYVIVSFDEQGKKSKPVSLFIKDKQGNIKGFNPDFDKAILALENTNIPIDKGFMQNPNSFQEVYIENNEIKTKETNYLKYIGDYVESNFMYNRSNRVNGQPIYVQDFSLTYSIEGEEVSGDYEMVDTNVQKKPIVKKQVSKNTKKSNIPNLPKVPDFNVPSMPSIAKVPNVKGIPSIPSFNIPSFKIPSMPALTAKELEQLEKDRAKMNDKKEEVKTVENEVTEEKDNVSEVEEVKPDTIIPSISKRYTGKRNTTVENKVEENTLEEKRDITPEVEDEFDFSPININSLSTLTREINTMKNSSIEFKQFTARFIERNVIDNTSLNEIEKLSLLKEAIIVSSFEDANKLFDKICKS